MRKSSESSSGDVTKDPSTYTVALDFYMCMRSRECLDNAPAVFGQAADGFPNVKVNGIVSDDRSEDFAAPLPADNLEAAQYAASLCPMLAIRVTLLH